jgi:hypothetical protein
MIVAARLTLLLLRRTTDRATLALPVVAFAVVTALTLTVLGGARFFFRVSDPELSLVYQGLAGVAVVLIVVPLLTLCGAAARLSTRRRDDRLATLRLLGAPRSTVAQVTVFEASALALAGALLGVVGHLALSPVTGLLRFHGEQLGAERVILPPLGMLACVAGMVLLATVSAVLGLRRVVVSPLGVRARSDVSRLTLVRLLAFAAAVALAVLAVGAGSGLGVAVFLGLVVGSFALTMVVLNLVGPLVVRAAARSRLRRSGRPGQAGRRPVAPGLIAARTVLDDPKAAWRQVSGVAMTSFMAVIGGVGVAVSSLAAREASGPQAASSRMMATDILTGVLVTIAISFVTVACAVAISQAASVLDRRDQLVNLHRMGLPVQQLNAARLLAVRRPLVLVSTGSAAIAAVVVFPLTGMALLTQPVTLLVVGAALVVGGALVLGAVRLTDPLVARLTADESAGLRAV